jgi:two-component system, NarL family, response regulator NreC
VCPPAQSPQERILRNNKIRCLLVHEHVLLRQGLRRLLEDQADMTVVSEAGNAAEALQRAFEHHPEVVIADSGSFACPAKQAERLILRESPHSKVLFLAKGDGETAPQEAPWEGDRHTVRPTSSEELVEMIRQIYSVESNVLQTVPRKEERAVQTLPRRRQRALTAREREVLELLAEGRTVRSVAQTLGVSIKTVDAHKFNLMRKLGVHNRAELVMWAIQTRVVKLPVNF